MILEKTSLLLLVYCFKNLVLSGKVLMAKFPYLELETFKVNSVYVSITMIIEVLNTVNRVLNNKKYTSKVMLLSLSF